eukprot:TRINITY_DN6737_c0_g1_i1.p1 TRINITY_DN6737_c0_g1~~TRINITY_DN6737_c0_g1_i1.p1  ORF type:complete len:562 (+),score=109.68 TRINITY_DN6737_c0_g1_i1:34-1719(+)
MFKSIKIALRKRKADTRAHRGNRSSQADLTPEDVLNNELKHIKEAKTGNDISLQLIQQVLLDVHEARRQLDDITELATSHKEKQSESESVAEKVAITAKKLDIVHSYLIEAFQNPLDIVLHKAQYGENSFDLDMLPEYVIGRIMNYLDFEDKKSLREVSPRLAEVVLLEDPCLRQWTIRLSKDNERQVARFLEQAKSKGITALANFQLHFQAFGCSEDIPVVKTWQEHVFGLETFMQPHLASFHLPQLQILRLECWEFGVIVDADGQAFKKLIRKCAPSLKKLSLVSMTRAMRNPEPILADADAPLPPNLQSLALSHICQDEARLAVLDLCRNVTELDVDQCRGMSKLSKESLNLPALKHLAIGGRDGFAFLMVNALHVESLYVKKHDDCSYEYDSMHIAVPNDLPNLKTFVYLAPGLQVLDLVLDAGNISLERLVMNSSDYPSMTDVKMKRLKHLVLADRISDHETDVFEFILKKKVMSCVEHLTIYDLQKTGTLDAFHECRLPRLKELILFVGELTTLEPFRRHENILQHQYNKAQVHLQRGRFQTFLANFLKENCGSH